MEEENLFNKIKQKEQDFIRTLTDIAKAEFITASLKSSSDNIEMDENQVDSDLSQVASEIAKSNKILDDNSDSEFEDIINDAVEINDCSTEHINENNTDSPAKNLQPPQTVIKVDVIDEINDTTHMEEDYTEVNQQSESEINLESNNHQENSAEEQQLEPMEESSIAEENTETSWKIEYIREINDECKKSPKKISGRNEVWRTSKSRKEKGKKHHSSKKSNREGRKCKKKESKNPHDTLASKYDREVSKKKNNVILKNDSKKTYSRQCKKVEDWNEVIQVTTEKIPNGLKQISSNFLDPYSPSVPRGTSQSCIDALSESDLEMLPCPGCQDRFFLPTTFFQHLLRKSVQINFNCKLCQKSMVFHNKCSLKIHILGHLESENIEKVETDQIDVLSLNQYQVKMNSDLENFSKEIKTLLVNQDHEDLCPECFSSVEKGQMKQHFIENVDENSNFLCHYCQKYLPTKCSLTAHQKIHKRMSPYVCPECGERFYTLEYFQQHVEQTCYHHLRTMINVCPLCPSQDKFTADKIQVLMHIAEAHSKQYFKCDICPSAFVDKKKLSDHWSEKHSNYETIAINNLYKIKIKSKTFFFTNKTSLIDQLEKNIELPSIFVFSCPCEEKFFSQESLSNHFQESPSCSLSHPNYKLFHEDPDESRCFTEAMDDLKYLQDQSGCSSCIKYNENYQKHLEKHQRKKQDGLSIVNNEMEKEKNINEHNESPVLRMTRLMKRSKSSEAEAENVKSVKLENSEHPFLKQQSPPLKLKIKLTPEIAKAIEPPIPPNGPIISAPKKEERKSKSKNSKVKFSIPEPLVESLGLDVPSGKDLILLNHLFHSPNAFFNGSVVKAKTKFVKYKCSICNAVEEDRDQFQNHIKQHKSCQSYHQCKECGACFAAEPSWKKHLLLMHRIKDPGPEHYCQDLLAANGEPFDYQSSNSETGDLVIDTGEETFDQNHVKDLIDNIHEPAHDQSDVYESHVPTCLACGANFSSTNLFREHKCDNNFSFCQYSVNSR